MSARAAEFEGEPNHRPKAASSPVEQPAPQDSLLERVLEHTLFQSSEAAALAPEDYASLVSVAQKYPGQALTVEPILVELIQAVLRDRVQATAASPAAWQTMLSEMAQTLYDDPAARARLETLWIGLQGQIP